MKKLISILSLFLALVITSCTHKELCDNHSEHAHRFHIKVIADYRLDWEEKGYRDWQTLWPEDYISYDLLRPSNPKGLRVVNYSSNGNYNIHNIPAAGGTITLYALYFVTDRIPHFAPFHNFCFAHISGR